MNERSKKISRLLSEADYRASYIRSKLSVLIPAQIRSLRGDMTQAALGQAVEMKQSRISAMETPGAVSFNLETLVRLAAAFKVGMVVKFVPFSDMLRWENSFAPDSFDVTRLNDDRLFLYPESASDLDPASFLSGGTLQQTIELPRKLPVRVFDVADAGGLSNPAPSGEAQPLLEGTSGLGIQ